MRFHGFEVVIEKDRETKAISYGDRTWPRASATAAPSRKPSAACPRRSRSTSPHSWSTARPSRRTSAFPKRDRGAPRGRARARPWTLPPSGRRRSGREEQKRAGRLLVRGLPERGRRLRRDDSGGHQACPGVAIEASTIAWPTHPGIAETTLSSRCTSLRASYRPMSCALWSFRTKHSPLTSTLKRRVKYFSSIAALSVPATHISM